MSSHKNQLQLTTLLSMDNVVALPHIGSATKETRLKMQLLAAENVVEGLMRGTPKNLINHELILNNR
ncbi:Glyoxylate/hydroxypyruvate reductase B [Ureibacillus acetophenoni]